MSHPYTVGEHDVPPGVTVCYVKDSRTGEIVEDFLHIDEADAIAESMNEREAAADDFDEDEDRS